MKIVYALWLALSGVILGMVMLVFWPAAIMLMVALGNFLYAKHRYREQP